MSPPPQRRPALVEYFLLADAEARAARLSAELRDRLDRALRLGRQRAVAADALWSNGHTAEGLRLAVDALAASLEGASAFEAEAPDPPRDGATGPGADPPPSAEQGAAEAVADASRDDASRDDASRDDASRDDASRDDASRDDDPGGDDASDDPRHDDASDDPRDDDPRDDDPGHDDAGDDDPGDDDPRDDASKVTLRDYDPIPEILAGAPQPEASAPVAVAATEEGDPPWEARAGVDEAVPAAPTAPAGPDDGAPMPGDPSGPEAGEAGAEAHRRAPLPPAGATADDTLADPDRWRAALERRGLSPRRIRRVLAAREAALGAMPLPELDAEVSPSHAELFQELLTAHKHVEGAIGPVARSRRQLMLTRAARLAYLAVAAAVALGAVWYFVVRVPRSAEAVASAVYGSAAEFRPDNAIDGDEGTEWLLPNGTAGHLDVRLSPARRITAIRLINAHNRHYNDRATREYRVEIVSGAGTETIEGVFPRLDPTPEEVVHEVMVDGVTQIRFVVVSWHNLGGGLAELGWDE
ncbi:MAG: discoidin domain-containing protein [Sandaracinaceae bacterium]